MTKMREGGRLVPVGQRKSIRGTLSTKKFITADTWFKVLELQPAGSYPGQHELYDPRVKECHAENSIIVFSGLAREEAAWVVQEWEVDVAPEETPVGKGWLKPERRYERLT
jgi:hypothetical protein